MKKFWPLKNCAILIMAVAFLMNAMLPFFAVYNPPASYEDEQNIKQMSSLFGEKILICTEAGFRLVSWNDLINGKEKPKPHPNIKCPLCYIAAYGQWIKPASLEIANITFPVIWHVSYHAANQSISAIYYWQRLFTRSPPESFTA